MSPRTLAVIALAVLGAGCAPVCPPHRNAPPEMQAAAPATRLDEARQLLKDGKFVEAGEAFRTVEQEFPGTEWAGSAAYALAVAAAMADNPQQDYASALMEFDSFIERYPQHERLPEAKAWRQAIKQIMDTRKENARLLKNIEKLKELDLQQEEKRRAR